jgi:hypothetical protein
MRLFSKPSFRAEHIDVPEPVLDKYWRLKAVSTTLF